MAKSNTATLPVAANTRVVSMKLDRETKGAVRMQEVDATTGAAKNGDAENALMGTQYFRKAALPNGKVPTGAKITVEFTYDE